MLGSIDSIITIANIVSVRKKCRYTFEAKVGSEGKLKGVVAIS
jgi:hypothetical protein